MARFISFFLIRLLALAWVLILTNLFQVIGPYAISILIIVSEVVFGCLWGKAEAGITVCKPKHEDPKLLFLLMIVVAVIESGLVVLLVGRYALWVIVWRCLTAYFPFSISEMITYERRCGVR
jgi:hypothetical protein